MQRVGTWKRVVAVVIATVMVGSIVITQENTGMRRIGFNDEQIRASPTHAPISIISDAAMLAFPDKTGGGSSGDPYVIQNYQIDGGDSTSCIELKNVISYYVTIRNCTLINSGSMLGDKDSGVELFNCLNIRITNCTIYNNLVGIWLIYSSAITIDNNHIHNNMYHGIWFENTGSTTVNYNRIESNSRHGIFLEESTSNSFAFNNCTSNNGRGIYLDTDTYSNTAYLNYFGLNIVAQAWDDGVGNVWDSPIGNRYSDYATRYPSAENDGIIWDTPYEINGLAYAVDTLPVFDVSGTHSPIRITSNAQVDTFCSGNSTNGSSWATAYRIRNYKISAAGGDYCIQLVNVSKYVIIEDCILINAYLNGWSSGGIKLQNCTNIQVRNCTIRYNTVGILFDYNNQHCIIDENSITLNLYVGIRVFQSHNLTIFNNTMSKNQYNGIHLFNYCKDNNISLNHIEENGINGIIIQDGENTTVEGNWLTNNFIGSQILNTNNCTVRNNHVENSTEYGFGIFDSPGNLILDSNQIINVSNAGIYLWASFGVNMISNNMTNASIVMEGSLGQLTSYSIGTSNKVNSKPLYYYHDQNDLSATNFTNAGEIILVNCNSSVISGAYCSSASDGLIVYYCRNVTVSDSTLTGFTSDGLFIKLSTNCTIAGNVITNCYRGISIDNCTDIVMTSNAFVKGGLFINANTTLCETLQIGISNTVNGRFLRYYVSQSLLGAPAFSNAGQIILINCNDSLVSNQNLSHGSYGIYCVDTHNINFIAIDAHSNHITGALFKRTTGVTISGGTFSDCGSNGVQVIKSDTFSVIGTVINGSFWGVFLDRTSHAVVANNTITNCVDTGVCISEALDSCIENNTISGTGNIGIYITVSNFTRLYANDISNNNVSGIVCYNCKWGTFIRNEVLNNGFGIYIAQNTSHNVLYFNSFAGNPDSNAFYELYFYGTNNTWSNGTEGNYWGDYESRYNTTATNLGRTWDTPYALSGNTTDVDPHPLVYPWAPNTRPSAAFTVALSTTILTTDPVQFMFTGTPGNTPASYQWGFGDGTTNGTAQHPLHSFNNQGNYTITLTITDADRQLSVFSRVAYIHAYTKGGDFDGDGLTNDMELNNYGTDLTKWDTDADGIPDGYEVHYGLNPFLDDANSDLDRDGLTNYQEYQHGTKADLADTDGDGFSDKVEVDWGTDPTIAFSSPLMIIMIPAGCAAVIVFLFLAVKAMMKKKKIKKKITYGVRVDSSWTDEELTQSAHVIEEKIDEKRAILSRVMEPMTAEEMNVTASEAVQDNALSTPGKKKGKESEPEETVTHKVDEKTESEVGVIKKKEFCIVCNTNLKATTYICPHCETKYCIRCAIALSEQHEACWVCKNPLNFSP